MSHLSLYDPQLSNEDDGPRILSFTAGARDPRIQDAALRARLARRHQQCPSCDRVTVDPIELGDARLNRNGAMIQGTATIVGFRCNACSHEWPIRERA